MTIDGVTLQRTEFDYVETDDAGNELRKARGHEYISADYRNFFSGQSEWWDGTQWLPLEGSPVQFSQPGEKGFGATQPIFECDAVMSQATPLMRLWQAAYDKPTGAVAPSAASPKE